MSNTVTIKNFEHLSVESRYVYALCCMEKAITHFNLQDPMWTLVLDSFWSFFEWNYPDDSSYRTYTFNDRHMSYPSMRYYRVYAKSSPEPSLDLDTFNKLAKMYYNSPEDMVLLVEEVDAILYNEWYSNRLDNSPRTLDSLEYIFEIMEKHQIPHPVVNWQILNAHTTKDSFHYSAPGMEKKCSKFLQQIRQTFK